MTAEDRAPRIALLAAMPFPLPQGSQVFLAEQARALARSGADVTVLCYGDGIDVGDAREASRGDPGLEVLATGASECSPPHLVRAPRSLSQTPLRAGPSARKPLADLALLGSWLRCARRRRFDAVLAHNAEAALVALTARPTLRVPVVYVAHTLLRHELSSYVPAALAGSASALGAWLDATFARRADAVIALSREAEQRLAANARGPVARIAPALSPGAPPSAESVRKTCALHGLSAGRFVLYAGNLDAYQDLADLAYVATRIDPVPVVVATHERHRTAPAPARTLRIQEIRTLRLLTHGAALCLIARRRPGGFPVKLLNYLEAGRAVVAHAEVGDGLTHDETGWLLPRGSSTGAAADAVARLLRDPDRCARLGIAGRMHLAAAHDPADRARDVLALVRELSNRGSTDSPAPVPAQLPGPCAVEPDSAVASPPAGAKENL